MRTFLEYYRRSIQPQIEMIDIFLKTEQPPYDKTAVAEVLGVSVEALTARMQKAARLHHEGHLFSPACGRGKSAWRHAEKSRCLRPARTLYTRSCGVCVRSALGGCPRSGRKNRQLLFFRGDPADLIF